jgi:hypothetical protein
MLCVVQCPSSLGVYTRVCCTRISGVQEPTLTAEMTCRHSYKSIMNIHLVGKPGTWKALACKAFSWTPLTRGRQVSRLGSCSPRASLMHAG